jgi:hypothetical protein
MAKISQVKQNLLTAQKEKDLYLLALSDCVNNKVKWFNIDNYHKELNAHRIGITRALSPCGGIVIIDENGQVDAVYFDNWRDFWSKYIPSSFDEEITKIRNFYLFVVQKVLELQREDMATNK